MQHLTKETKPEDPLGAWAHSNRQRWPRVRPGLVRVGARLRVRRRVRAKVRVRGGGRGRGRGEVKVSGRLLALALAFAW